METIFDVQTLAGFIKRINLLKLDNKALWGKMNACQMLKHCTLREEMLQSKKPYKRLFGGKLFGPMTLKRILKYDKPTGKKSANTS